MSSSDLSKTKISPENSKISSSDLSNIKILPDFYNSTPFDVAGRIEQLRNYIDPNHPDYVPSKQHINIKAVIKLYEEGKIDGKTEVYIKEGKSVSKEEIYHGPASSWVEGMEICYLH